MVRWHSVGLCTLLVFLSLDSLADIRLTEEANAMLASVYPADAPGASVVVSRDGEVIYQAAFGLADVELGLPLQTHHVFRLASVSKQYASAALLSLVEAGEIALDDPLSNYLPDFPQGDVLISQLLNHTSGIKSYTNIDGYMMSERIRADVSTEALVAVFADETPDFAPGEDWAYNNSGYVLVGAVIEAVSGKSWNDYLRETLLLPNGIEQTDAYADDVIVPGRVPGYDGPQEDPRRARFLSMTQPHAGGALMATAADVDRWQVALHGGDILDDVMYARMITPEGAAVAEHYGFGIGAREWFGQPALSHGGGIFGFNTYALYLPDEALSIVVLSNRAGPGWGPSDVSLRLAGLATGRSYPIEAPALDWHDEELIDVQGTYRINDEEARTIRLDEGRLISQRNGGREFVVYPIADDRLAFETSLSVFHVERNDAGEVVSVALQKPWGGEPERAVKISDEVKQRGVVDVSVEQLQRLAGRYQLMPNFVMTAQVVNETLKIQATGQPAVGMQAESPTRFFNYEVGAVVEFDLPDEGSATGLTLTQGGRTMPAPRIGDWPE